MVCELEEMFHKCLVIAALFQSWTLLRPSPPSSLGRQTTSQTTLAALEIPTAPCQRKDLRIWSITLHTSFGKMLEKGDSLLTNSFMVFQLLPLGIVNTQQSVLGLPSSHHLVKKPRVTIPQLQSLNSGLLFEVGLFHKSEMSQNFQTLFFCIC